MTKSTEPSATSEENTIIWGKVCVKPVSEYAGFGGPEKVQMDDNGMFYNYLTFFFSVTNTGVNFTAFPLTFDLT